MANTNTPHGFRPLMRSVTGGPASCLPAHKIVGESPALFIGDAVQLGGSGTKNNAAIKAAAATTSTYGVVLNYGAVSTATDHTIIPAHMQVFEAQIDTLTIAQLQMNCALVATAGDAPTKVSRHSLGSIATTNTLEWRSLELWQSPDNVAGAYARILVTPVQSQWSDQVAGV